VTECPAAIGTPSRTVASNAIFDRENASCTKASAGCASCARVPMTRSSSRPTAARQHGFRAFRDKDQAMEIEGTTFGTITIDGKTYEHDVIIRLSGEVVKRKKKLSKKYYGTSHVLSKDEAKFVFERGCEQLILGSGQMGNVHLSPEAEAYFAEKGCKVLLQPTPEAIGVFNKSHAKKIGLFHLTC
jgi:hypothetical protein